MKRILLLLLIIFTFSFSKPLKISACQYQSICNPNAYDCNNPVGPVSLTESCDNLAPCNGNCCSEITAAGQNIKICFPPKGTTLSPPTCTGQLGCSCRTDPGNPCDPPLIAGGQAPNCTCLAQPLSPCTPGTEECQCRASAPRCDSGLQEVNFLLACTCKKSSFIPVNNPWANPCKDNNKIPTAIGCIDYTNTSGLTKSLLTFALGVGGGIAFLLMIIGSFMIMTSSGNPERQQAGKEMITSAIMGLLLILLSVFILQLIGVKILAIPGFG
jgi:hypothetical protein